MFYEAGFFFVLVVVVFGEQIHLLIYASLYESLYIKIRSVWINIRN